MHQALSSPRSRGEVLNLQILGSSSGTWASEGDMKDQCTQSQPCGSLAALTWVLLLYSGGPWELLSTAVSPFPPLSFPLPQPPYSSLKYEVCTGEIQPLLI